MVYEAPEALASFWDDILKASQGGAVIAPEITIP